MEKKFDVVGLGNAMVDVLAQVEDSFIEENSLYKGSMSLISEERSEKLYEAMPKGVHKPGGSAANTMVGISALGGSVAYIGKISDDPLGKIFDSGMSAAGVSFGGFGLKDLPTARCLIQVTPDAQRTLNTYLGISAFLSPEDVNEKIVASGEILYCEGYLWDTRESKEAIRKAMNISKTAGKTVALSLSDIFCVERHRNDWLSLLDDFVDLVFCNEEELKALYQTDDLTYAAEKISKGTKASFVTLGAKGSLVVNGEQRTKIDPIAVTRVVDTTGAGDIYASGVLFGLTQNLPLETSAQIGSILASEVIQDLGPRLTIDPQELVKDFFDHTIAQ